MLTMQDLKYSALQIFYEEGKALDIDLKDTDNAIW